MTGIQFPAGATMGFFLCHHNLTSSGAHPAPYPMGAMGARGKEAEV